MDKKEIKELGNAIVTLQREAVKQTLIYWKPEAEKIINTKSKDINNIEISEKEFEKIEYIAKDLCREINNCMLNLTKLKYLQN